MFIRFKRNIRVLLLYIILFSAVSFGDEVCEIPRNNNEVRYIINLVERQLNINSLKCTYTAIVNDIPSYIDLLKEKGREVNEAGIFKGEMQTYDFIFSGGNFLQIMPIIRIRNVSNEEKNISDNTTPRNIFELIVLKEYEKRKAEIIDNTPQDEKLLCYFYNGKLKVRNYFYMPKFERALTAQVVPDNFSGFMLYLDPRVSIGYIKGKIHESPFSNLPIHITEFFNKEGKFYYYEKDGYKVLWHGVELERGKKTEPVGIEIWVDASDNIYKIRSIFYPARFVEKERLRQLLTEGTYNCNYPYIIFWEYIYSDYREFNNNIRIPMRTMVLDYDDLIEVKTNPALMEIIEKYKKPNGEDSIAIYTKISQYPDISVLCRKREILIHPESTVINESIPEETFIAPEPDIPLFRTQKEAREYLRKLSKQVHGESSSNKRDSLPAIIFITSCIIITFIGIFITKRYFGWGA